MANLGSAFCGLGTVAAVEAAPAAINKNRFMPDNTAHEVLLVRVTLTGFTAATLRPVYIRNTPSQTANIADEPICEGCPGTTGAGVEIALAAVGTYLLAFPAWPGWRSGIRVQAVTGSGTVAMMGQYQRQT